MKKEELQLENEDLLAKLHQAEEECRRLAYALSTQKDLTSDVMIEANLLSTIHKATIDIISDR